MLSLGAPGFLSEEITGIGVTSTWNLMLRFPDRPDPENPESGRLLSQWFRGVRINGAQGGRGR